jgi:hypothetical protein
MYICYVLRVFIKHIYYYEEEEGEEWSVPYPLDRIGWYFCIFIPGRYGMVCQSIESLFIKVLFYIHIRDGHLLVPYLPTRRRKVTNTTTAGSINILVQKKGFFFFFFFFFFFLFIRCNDGTTCINTLKKI